MTQNTSTQPSAPQGALAGIVGQRAKCKLPNAKRFLSPPHSFCLTIAHCADSAGAGASWRLAHSVQEIFQNHGVVSLFIPGGEKQGQLFSAVGQTIEFIEGCGGFWTGQLFEI